MRPEDEHNITYIRRRGRSLDPPMWEEDEVVREEETREETPSIILNGKQTTGEEDYARINNLFNILNDLDNGQKVMMDLMGQLDKNSLEVPTKQN
jgi:hypothetical protein